MGTMRRAALLLGAALGLASASNDQIFTSFLQSADDIFSDELENGMLPAHGHPDFMSMLNHLETSLKDAAHDMSLEEPTDDKPADLAPEDSESPFPADSLKDLIGHIIGEEAQRPVEQPHHTLLNIRARLHDPQIRRVIIIGHPSSGGASPLSEMLGGMGGTPPPISDLINTMMHGSSLAAGDEGMHPHMRMMIMMPPHAFNPHLMVPPSFAMPPPQIHMAPPPMSLGHMAPPSGIALPPIHFRMIVHGMPHGSMSGTDANVPEGLSEIVNEMMPKILPQMMDAVQEASTQDKVKVIKVHPTVATMAKKANHKKDEALERVWDSEKVDDVMRFSTALPAVTADAVKVQAKKDVLRITGHDASKKPFAFVYPVGFEIDAANVNAHMADGKLSVTVHRKVVNPAPHHSGFHPDTTNSIKWTDV